MKVSGRRCDADECGPCMIRDTVDVPFSACSDAAAVTGANQCRCACCTASAACRWMLEASSLLRTAVKFAAAAGWRFRLLPGIWWYR